MALRTLLGCLPVAALAICAWTACKDKGDAAKTQPSADELGRRCVQLAKACGEKDIHIGKIAEECILAAKKQVENSCAAKAFAVYDCYEKEICGKFENEKVWAIDDFRVLAERHSRCLAQRNTSEACVAAAK